MIFPIGGTVIVQALYEQHTNLARGTDDERRHLTMLIAQTFCARFGPQWGTKSTTKSHPLSKDAIAFDVGKGVIDVFDWQNGNTRLPQVIDSQPPTHPRLLQFFVAVEPIDHLKLLVDPPPPPPPPAPPPREEQLERLINEVQQLVGELRLNSTALAGVRHGLDRLVDRGVKLHL